MRLQVITKVLKSVDGVVPRAGTPLPKHVKMAASPFSFMRGSAEQARRDWAMLKDSLAV